MKIPGCLLLAALFLIRAGAQSILFDFDNAPRYTPLPITLSAGGVSETFSGTGAGYSIQAANTMGFTPAGFAGNCIYPSSINLSDLKISSSVPLTGFSVLYAVQELACDSSATMRVTAYRDGALVGTAITNAQAGTWPTETLQFGSMQPFNSVVVHWDKAPITGGDYGCIYMADNVRVTPAPAPPVVSIARMNTGACQFSFTNWPGRTFTVLGTTNLSLALTNWTVLGTTTETTPCNYQYTEPQPGTNTHWFYRVCWP